MGSSVGLQPIHVQPVAVDGVADVGEDPAEQLRKLMATAAKAPAGKTAKKAKKNKGKGKRKKGKLQPVDFTTLLLACKELNATAMPARLEGAHQIDRQHLLLALRVSAQTTAWLELSWHSGAARLARPLDPDGPPAGAMWAPLWIF